MSNAACIGGDLYPIVVKHPWRPGRYVLSDGVRGSVSVVGDGSGGVLVMPSLRGSRSVAVNPKIIGWGSEATKIGLGVVGGVKIATLTEESSEIVASSKADSDASGYVCSCLQWNEEIPSQIAAAYQPEDARLASLRSCVKIYDLDGNTTLSPVKEFRSDCAYSLTWISHCVLLTSTSDGLVAQDVRSQPAMVCKTDSKAPIYHLSHSPSDTHTVVGARVAYDGSSLLIWDTRKLDKGPVVTLSSRHVVGSLAWHDKADVFLTAAIGEEGTVEIWDIKEILCRQQLTSTDECGYESDYDCKYSETSDTSSHSLSKSSHRVSTGPKKPFSILKPIKGHQERRVGQPITSAAWGPPGNPSSGLHLMLLSSGILTPFKARQYPRMVMGPLGELVTNQSDGETPVNTANPLGYNGDVGYAIKLREEAGFGSSQQRNYEIALQYEDRPLQQWAYWCWLMRRVTENMKEGAILTGLPGVMKMYKFKEELVISCLKPTAGEAAGATSPEEDRNKGHHAVLCKQFKTYDSEWRKVVCAVAGWADVEGIPKSVAMQSLTTTTVVEEYERQIALEILHLRLWKAEEMLRDPPVSSPVYSLLAFSLTGLTIDTIMVWKDTCLTLSGITQYLCSALQFLSAWHCGGGSHDPWGCYKCVLDEPAIDPIDKLGFATRYLGDAAYEAYLEKLLADETIHPLTRVLLEGISDTEQSSLTSFLECTGDIQLAAFTAVMFTKYSAPETQKWVKCYREFLGEGCSVHARCRAEVLFSGLKKVEPGQEQVPPPQPLLPHPGRRRALDTKRVLRMQKHLPNSKPQPPAKEETKAPLVQVQCTDCRHVVSQNPRVSVCSKCQAPLPKCSVCIQVLGIQKEPIHQLTWCLTCQHGGHVDHLLEWFTRHEHCPVAGCECHCATLDE
eukprot:TRINITY_DN13222_c0_g1_i2.p1 TRINITY_DN13222_c0_g1~~TRINITY_DN13222_c0_g1_i2.p1  ORF type:complete len:902 (+),score=174.55 TRINITY_DN13222_c0_g1_i2:129-2834(+)